MLKKLREKLSSLVKPKPKKAVRPRGNAHFAQNPEEKEEGEQVDILLENEEVYDNQDETRRFESRKMRLLKKIDKNLIELDSISEQLFEKGFKTYYDKIIDIIEQSRSLSRILKKLDNTKPYAKELIMTVKKQTAVVSGLIVKLYS